MTKSASEATFAEYVASFIESNEEYARAFDEGELEMACFCCEPSEPTDLSNYTLGRLKSIREEEKEIDERHKRYLAIREQKRFVHDTCFPIPDYWETTLESGRKVVTVTVSKRRRGPTTYMLQIAPSTI